MPLWHRAQSRLLQTDSANIHHCITHGLSHPTDPAFQATCGVEHTETDALCLQRDRLWRDLLGYIDGVLASTDVAVVAALAATGLPGEDEETTRRGKLDFLRVYAAKLREQHFKYVGHLMLDWQIGAGKMQMKGIVAEGGEAAVDCVAWGRGINHFDYMMKLKAGRKDQTGGEFHIGLVRQRYM